MNIKMKKLMSLLLCFAMLFGMLPVEVFAVETGAETGIAAEENVAEVPAEGAPSADEPVVEDPLVEEHAAEEPVTDEPVAEESAAEEPVTDEPAVEEPVVEEPEVEEPMAEEPAVEQPAADEPDDEPLSFDFEASVPTLAAVTPQMPYYNDSNYVAYDVENIRGSGGANDKTGTYVTSVTLGGVSVSQANSKEPLNK